MNKNENEKMNVTLELVANHMWFGFVLVVSGLVASQCLQQNKHFLEKWLRKALFFDRSTQLKKMLVQMFGIEK